MWTHKSVFHTHVHEETCKVIVSMGAWDDDGQATLQSSIRWKHFSLSETSYSNCCWRTTNCNSRNTTDTKSCFKVSQRSLSRTDAQMRTCPSLLHSTHTRYEYVFGHESGLVPLVVQMAMKTKKMMTHLTSHTTYRCRSSSSTSSSLWR